jgi:peroxiredoxin
VIKLKKKGIDDIFCLSVNDKFVMQSWLLSYSEGDKIKGIADGNAEISKALEVTSDKSSNFMGLRCLRFAFVVENNVIIKKLIEDPGKLDVSSAESIFLKL